VNAAKGVPANPGFQRIRISGPFCKKMWGKKFRDFDFKPGVNILCGPNGCGKSTILKALFPTPKKEQDGLRLDTDIESLVHMDSVKRKVWGTPGAMVRRFDFEMNNPRVQRGVGMMSMEDMSSWARGQRMRAMSHGEVQKLLFDNLLSAEATKGAILLLDEPEQALDMEGATKLLTILRKTKRQYIISTHSPFLILEKKFNVIEMKYRYVSALRTAYQALLKGDP
jgi:predicted ATPase